MELKNALRGLPTLGEIQDGGWINESGSPVFTHFPLGAANKTTTNTPPTQIKKTIGGMAAAAEDSGRGAFFVFEGIDGTGKSTHAKQLTQRMSDLGFRVQYMRFPFLDSDSRALRRNITSDAIESFLHVNKMKQRFSPPKKAAEDYTIEDLRAEEAEIIATHKLFSANRWENYYRIEAALQEGICVVCDRYAYSGIAYSMGRMVRLAKKEAELQCVKPVQRMAVAGNMIPVYSEKSRLEMIREFSKPLEKDCDTTYIYHSFEHGFRHKPRGKNHHLREWMKNDDRGLPRPDVVFYMKPPPMEDEREKNANAAAAEDANDGESIYDLDKELLRKYVAKEFDHLAEGNWVKVYCSTSIEENMAARKKAAHGGGAASKIMHSAAVDNDINTNAEAIANLAVYEAIKTRGGRKGKTRRTLFE